MSEIELFIRDASGMRGIVGQRAVDVANTEGGVTEPARLGDFSGPPWYSGKSWWPFQLHYGGIGTPYEAWGHTAGMGNGFTTLTGWKPGDPKAWRDSVRYALNRVKTGGWGPWYGAASIGITGFMGVDRSFPWDPNSEKWDFETGVDVPLPRVVFNPTEPPHLQDRDFDCSQDAAEWMLWSVGRRPTDQWMTQTMLAEGVMTPEHGLMQASGEGLAAFLERHYGEFGYSSSNDGDVSFDDVRHEAGRYPLAIGGRQWNHWSGCYGYDAGRDVLLLANPAPNYVRHGIRVGNEMTRDHFRALGSFSLVRLLHPDLGAATPNPNPGPPPIPVTPPPVPLDNSQYIIEIARLNELLRGERDKLGVATVNYPNDMQPALDSLQNTLNALRKLTPSL